MSRSLTASIFVVLFSLALLSACGGGGGGGSTTSTPTPSNAAPVADAQSISTDESTAVDITLTGSDGDGDSLSFAVSVDPANGTLSGTAPNLTYTPATDFSGADEFTFTVNDGTETSAAATISITVTPLYAIGGTVTGAVNTGLTLENNGADSLEVAGTSFEFPVQLAESSTYEVTVAAPPSQQLCTVDDASGTVATADVTDVAVLCRAWGSDESIEFSADLASSPQIAFDGSGDAIAIWIQDDGSYDRVMSNTYTAGVGWDTPTQVSGSTGDATSPQILVDSDGDAIAVWAQAGPSYTNLWANLYEKAGSGWGTAGFIEYNDGDVRDPQVALDEPNGHGIVVWEQDTSPGPSPSNIWAIDFEAGSGWGTAELIETDGGNAQLPQVAFDSVGNAIAVWYQYDGSSKDDILANIWTDTGGWGTATEIESTDDGSSRYPQIVFDSTDKATVVWASDDGSRYNIWATTWTEADDWGSDELLETQNDGDATYPQIAVDSNDNLMAVWQQHDGTRNDIRSNYSTPADGWGTAELVESTDSSFSNPQVAFDGDGNAIAVWRGFSIQSNTWSPGAGWSTEELLETDESGAATEPQIGFDGNYNAIAVWTQDDSVTDNIRSNRFD